MQLLDDVNQKCSILQHDLRDYMDAVVHRQGVTVLSGAIYSVKNARSSQEHLVQRLDTACSHPETSITCCTKLCYPILCARFNISHSSLEEDTSKCMLIRYRPAPVSSSSWQHTCHSSMHPEPASSARDFQKHVSHSDSDMLVGAATSHHRRLSWHS